MFGKTSCSLSDQAHLFHVSDLPKNVQNLMYEQFSLDELPRNCYYGDDTDEREPYTGEGKVAVSMA